MNEQEFFRLAALAPLISLVCLAVHACIWWEGMVLHFIRVRYRAAVNELAEILASHVELDKLHNEPTTVLNAQQHARIICRAAWLIKPFYACLMCMASVWTITVWLMLGHPITWHLLVLMLLVCGINIILDTIIYKLRGHGDDSQL